MPVIQVENVAPDSTTLGMLPFFRDLEEGFADRAPFRAPVLPRFPIFGFPVRALPTPPSTNGGFLPPWLRWRWQNRQTPPPAPPPVTPSPILPPVNSGPLPPSPVVVMDHANPGSSEAPATGAPATTPATGAPVSTMTPPVPLVGAPVVSAVTSSMFAAPSSGSSMFASSGAPVASSMFGTVQGSGSQVAKVSGENALSGVPDGGGRTIGLVALMGLVAMTAWGFHLNKQDAKRHKAKR